MSVAPNPAAGLAPDVSASAFTGSGASMAMAIWFDDRIFDRAKQIAGYLAKAQGFVPQHLLGKPEACFAIVERSLTWKLSPYAVAQSTYQTPGGKVGFEGKLCQAILENSGRLKGGVKYEFFCDLVLDIDEIDVSDPSTDKPIKTRRATMRSSDPECKKALAGGYARIVERRDWNKVQGKFRKQASSSGKGEFPVPNWKPEDEVGLGVIVRAEIIGEAEPREFEFEFVQAFPRNSTLWATDPKTQLCYLAVRRFSSVAAPGIFMGVPFDDETAFEPRDVTPPRPTRSDFASDKSGPSVTEVEAELTPEQQAAADREAREFAMNGGAQSEDDHREDGDEAGGQDASTGDAGIQQTVSQSEANVEFWRRESLEIIPTPVGRSFEWAIWQKEITGRIAEAASVPDIDALERMNADHIDALSAKYVRMGDEVKNAFAKRRVELDQGEA